MKIETLKRPSEFKRIRGGARWACPLFVIEGRARGIAPGVTAEPAASGPRFGFTITRKVGGAVVRNRIRRRLREALRTLGQSRIKADHDYVVVASRAAHDYPFAGLQASLREAFERLDRQGDRSAARGRRAKVQPAVERGAEPVGAGDAVELAVERSGRSEPGPQPDPGARAVISGTKPRGRSRR
ncbi:MAG: ribonuclease P protein component [Hyphomicrobiaceae bacterium]